jgi:DNA-binding CsgD family transcriptional regulator
MIGHADTQVFSRAALDLYEPGLTDANFPERGFRFLSVLLAFDASACGVLDKRARSLAIRFDRPHADLVPAVEGFGRCMAKYPLFRFDPAVNGGRPFCRSDFFSARQFRDLDIYQEGFRLLGLNNHCAVHVPTDDNTVLFFGLERSGRTDFSSRERDILTLAQPHLANARRLAAAATAIAGQAFEPSVFSSSGFSSRQAEVLYWLTQGKSNVEIAALLRVQLSTVKTYLRQIFDKLGVNNRLAATLCAFEISRRSLRKIDFRLEVRVPHPGRVRNRDRGGSW